MLINITELIQKYNLKINGIIHVGGNIGEEIAEYKNYTNNIHMFEPLQESFNQIDNSIKKYNVGLGSKKQILKMFISNNKASSSFLKPKDVSIQYPHILFEQAEKQFQIETLDSFNITDCNFMNIDVQGYELEVLKGSIQTLQNIQAIYIEINLTELYENCVIVTELDDWLLQYNFKRVETKIAEPYTWGDALYLKMEE